MSRERAAGSRQRVRVRVRLAHRSTTSNRTARGASTAPRRAMTNGAMTNGRRERVPSCLSKPHGTAQSELPPYMGGCYARAPSLLARATARSHDAHSNRLVHAAPDDRDEETCCVLAVVRGDRRHLRSVRARTRRSLASNARAIVITGSEHERRRYG